jgi:hypothetical protein
MSAEARAGLGDRLGHMRRSFREWRWQRPFWSGLLTLLGGIPIMYLPYANLTLGTMTIRMATTAGAGSLIIGVLLVVLGLTMWFQKHSRVFAGVAAILLALVSLVVSNFGGFFIGFLLALVGGALAVSWAPDGAGAADGAQAEPAQSEPVKSEPADEDPQEPGTADFTPAVSGVTGATYVVSGDGEDLLGNKGTNGRYRAR